MAAYAALLSLSQTTNPQHESLFSSDEAEKVRSIHNYVNSLLWFFKEFPQKVNYWEGRIRDVAYEIDTVIQTSMLQQILSRDGVMNPSLENQLENVMERLGVIAGEVTEEQSAYLPASSSSSTLPTVASDAMIDLHKEVLTAVEEQPANLAALTSSSSILATVGNDAVIDLHEAVLMEIKDKLFGESRKLQVIPIAGMGGIGKTTLARILYDDQCIIEHFGTRAWGVASQDYSPLRFWRNLLGSMTVSGKEMVVDEIDESSLKLKVYQTLKGRRYIIVVDDVWEKQVWDDVKAYFPDDDNGSCIILTTRELDIAIHPQYDGHVHKMECLDESQSWDLLRQKVFTNGYCPPELEGVGKRIAGRCGGLPLAVVLVAGVLSAANEISQASWQEIAENVSPIVGRELEAVLSLSYTNLPHYLRSCFLFIGGFQKDVNIRNSRLIRLWAAEGFEKMEKKCQKSLEGKAEEYLEELVKRNLVVVTSRKSDGKIKNCGLHDLVRELCIRKAHEEKFLRVMDELDLPQVSINEPRISFSHSNVAKVSSPTLRTILCVEIQSVPSWLGTLGEYKLLKELDALGVKLEEIPSQLFELYHLRYLALMGSFSIPSDVSNLVNLQTLIIHLPFGKLRERYAGVVPHSLPLEIWTLRQLRHLLFHAPYVLPHPPQELIDLIPLQHLQTLLLVADFVWNETILQLIPNVNRLGLTYTSNKEYHLHLVEHLHLLEKLEVTGYPGFSWGQQNPSFPPTLKKLTLVGGRFPWSDMAVVGSLPNLQVLKLLDNACEGEKWETAVGDFPSLTILVIDESSIREWEVESDSFPRLKRLVLRSCPFLEEIPQDMGDIPTLELIEVDYCAQSLLASAEKIKEDQEDNGNVALQVRIGREYVNLRSVSYSRRETERAIAAAATKFLLNTLKDLLTHHSDLIKDTRGNIENLESDLLLFKAFLMDTVNLRERDQRAKAVVKEILNVVYEVEDIIEVFLTKAIQRRNKSVTKVVLSKVIQRRNKRDVVVNFWSTSDSDLLSIGQKVEAIKGKIERCRQEIGISLDEGEHEEPEPLPPRKKDVISFDDVTEHLISRLVQETDYLDVISIIGRLGLGKTMVARKIFNDPRVVYKFPTRIWLPISQQFTDKEIFLGILKEFTSIGNNIRARKDHELAEFVCRCLRRGNSLIVFDDVWSCADWDRLRVALRYDNILNKVLITSRIEEVGTYASRPRPPYNLRSFKPEESWELFRLEALHTLDCPPELEDVGRKIVRNCDGIPLAIVIMGAILARKFSPRNLTARKRYWEEVSPRVYSYLNENETEKLMQELIYLSYDNLPYNLRACFLYLGMFPEDYEIPVLKLIRMWIAEGFVQQNNQESLEETAHKYLEDLISRNLVKNGKFKADGKVKTCMIHDTLRDFCRIEAANANFLQEIRSNIDGQFVPSTSNITKYRRLSIHSNYSKFITLKPLGPCVRSFVSFPKDEYDLSAEEGASIINAFPLLRVLDVLAFKFTAIDTDLYKLVHTRYIAFSSKLSVLPSGFNKLWNIQTLIVYTTSRTLQVKADIWKMEHLRHFKTNASATLPKRGECGKHGAELQTLGSISVESCTKELFDRACNLKKLGIRGELAFLFDIKNGSFDCLGKMKKLGKLKLINDVYPEPPSTCRLHYLPEPCHFPSGLTSLTLYATFLSWEHMSTLGRLKKLEVLKLKECAFMGISWVSVDGGFQSLEVLHIEETDLVVWIAASHHYPKLRDLVLRNCENLRQIPIQLANIPTLQVLEVFFCRYAVQSARQISYAKIKAGVYEFKLSILPPYE